MANIKRTVSDSNGNYLYTVLQRIVHMQVLQGAFRLLVMAH
ncbi:hypothetical protein VPH209E381_0020 [Vibrio phage 209E38-1]